jgi:glycerophosphoryl diester phosphodiesterase
VLFFDSTHIGVLNDNNFPFSLGRHVGSGKPDDNEFVIIELGTPLATDAK